MNDFFPKGQLAQLFMVGFSGTDFGDGLAALMETHNFTSFIIFEKNVRGRSGLSSMIREARSLARSLGLPPLLFAADEEGGLISPLGDVVGRLPSAMAISAAGSPDKAREAATLVGEEIKSLGVDLVLAPVLDVNRDASNPVIGTRSFGDDPAGVARMGTAVIEGYHSAGLACCAKHFPGHGNTSQDSHEMLPVVRSPAAEVREQDLLPFARAFERDVGAVMTAHVAVPALDGGAMRPATLSGRIQTELLRNDMGFRGTLLSDSMEMSGLVDAMAPEDACIEALIAGVDLFVCVDPNLARRCLCHLEMELARGGQCRAAARRAITNVSRLKEMARCEDAPAGYRRAGGAKCVSRAIAGAGTKGLGNGRMRGRAAGREAVLGECYERSITLVDCRSGELREALRGMDRGLMMVPEGLPGYDKTDLDLLERSLSGFQIAERWSVFSYPFDPTPNDTAAAVSRMQSSGGAVLCTLSRGPEPPGQRELATAALETGKLRAGVALLDPYGLARLFPTGLPGVATYGFWPECLRALLETLFAPVEIGGHREAYGPAEAARLLEAAGSVSGASRPSSLFTATGVLPVDIHRSG